jgi:hypothetical protein
MGELTHPYFERRLSAKDRARPEGSIKPLGPEPDPWLKVDRLDDLFEHEPRILSLIEGTLNGGLLFLTHPFRFLQDLGVVLSDSARYEAITRVPELGALSDTAYDSARAAARAGSIEVHLHGLFPREREERT